MRWAWIVVASLAVPGSAAAQWSVDVAVTSGPLTISDAASAVEARLGDVAECADGPGPFLLIYAVSVAPGGGIRQAAPDRGTDDELAPRRAVRCVRHVLEELELPERAEASQLVVTFSLGDALSPPEPSVSPPSASPAPSAPSASGPRVTLGDVGGGAAVRTVVEAGVPSLSVCYATARATDAALRGDGVIHVTVGADGRVTRAMFAGPEDLASAMALCLGNAARTWRFAAAEARFDVGLSFTP